MASRVDPVFSLLLVLWTVQTCLNVLYATFFGANILFHDDVFVLSGLAGTEPLSASWLWGRLSEHRFPVVRLILWAISRLTDNDFRFHFILNSLVLSLTGLVLLLAVRRWRGRSSLFDFTFIGFAMSWIHFWNLLQAVGLTFVLYQLLLALVFVAILFRFWESDRLTLVMAALMTLLVLNGGIGLVTAAPLAVFVAVCGAVLWRRGRTAERRRSLIHFATVGGVVLLAGAMVFPSGLTNDALPPPRWSARSFEISVRMLTMSVGLVARELWYAGPTLTLLIAEALFLGVVVTAMVTFREGKADRLRVGGFVATMAGTLLIAAAVAMTRYWAGRQAGLWAHYATAAAPLPGAVYLMVQGCPRPLLRHTACSVLLALSLFGMVTSYSAGWEFGTWRREGATRLMQSVRAGFPLENIVHQRREYFYYAEDARFVEGLRQERERRQGPFGEEPVAWFGRLPTMDYVGPPRPSANTKPAGLRAVDEGEVKRLGSRFLLMTESEGTAFRLPSFKRYGSGPMLVRIELLSPKDSIARLITEREREGSAEILERRAPCRQGYNALHFLIQSDEPELGNWRLVPGGADATYRVEGISYVDMPAEPAPAAPRLHFVY